MGNVKFGDISTKDLDLIVQAPPTYTFPEKDVEIQHVPGRNGDIVIDRNCYKNVTRIYSIASVFRSGTDFIANSERLIEWLTSNPGYQRLEDSYDPDVYRMATYKESGSLVNYWDQATAINIIFECKPQRYLKVGEIPLEFTGNTINIYNPTFMPALPKISISNIPKDPEHVLMMDIRNYKGEVSSIVTIETSDAYNEMTIDSENKIVYEKSGNNIKNLGEYINFNGLDFPKLEMKDSTIALNKYLKENQVVKKYNDILDNNKETVFALYKPYETLVNSKQDSAKLRSYDQLIESAQEIFPGEAYASFCIDNSTYIKFESFNDVIRRKSTTISFNTSLFAKPIYGAISYREYKYGQGEWKAGSWNVIKAYDYYLGDRVVVKVKTYTNPTEYGWKIYQVIKGNTDVGDPDKERYHVNGWADTQKWPKPLNNEYFQAVTDLEEDFRSDVPKMSQNALYGWDVLPSESAMPENVSDAEKQVVLISRLDKDKNEKITVNNTFMFLYPTEFTAIKVNSEIIRYGAFVYIQDHTDDDQSMQSIKYIECIPEEYKDMLNNSAAASENNISKDFYNNVKVGHNLIEIFPNLVNIIGQNHDCSITLFKAKWVFDENEEVTDEIGHPELDLELNIDENSTYIKQEVVYNFVKVEDPEDILNAEEYDPDNIYNQGSYCLYKFRYYKCNLNNTTGPWQPSRWDPIEYNNGDKTEVLAVKYVAQNEFYTYNNTSASGIFGAISALFGKLFNSSGWALVKQGNILESAEWSTRDKAFMYKSTFKESSDYSVERYCILKNDLPLYEDYVIENEYRKDKNGNVVLDSAGNKVNKIIKARFSITSVDDDMKKIVSIKSNSDGYYKILTDSNEPAADVFEEWKECSEDETIPVGSYNLLTTKSYKYLFIDKSPDYQSEEDFPEWLDYKPLLYNRNQEIVNSEKDKLNAVYYDFKVNKKAFYRYLFINDKNVQLQTEWILRDKDEAVGILEPHEGPRLINEIVTFNKIDKSENSDAFPIVQFHYISNEPDNAELYGGQYIFIENFEIYNSLLYDGREYNNNETCIFNNALYACINDTTQSPEMDPNSWRYVGRPIIAMEYNKENSYAPSESGSDSNAWCLYGRTIYKCISATPDPAGEWNDETYQTYWSKLGYYVRDVGFYYLDKQTGQEIEYPGNVPDAEWLKIKIERGSKSDFTDTQLQFYVGETGYYKWDTNLEWLYKEASEDLDLLTAGNANSDTYLYYLQQFPNYTDLDQELYDATIIPSASGNPEHVEIKVKKNGYYKIESSTEYRYYLIDDIILNMTIYESPTIIHLEDDTYHSLDNVNITIIPRWWKL